MAPSFPRQSASPLSPPLTVLRRRGTRPWLNGVTLTSSGHRELDAILGGCSSLGSTGSNAGGGMCLGTVLVVVEDRFSSFAEDIGLYFVAEVNTCAEGASVPVPSR
mmetsp:Transcript_9151/g.20216  ORF Transcript_9151/g.20216 Transcript_9151/m.20216 type:complete len:106 (-) Transcript_9151:16-333(-)